MKPPAAVERATKESARRPVEKVIFCLLTARIQGLAYYRVDKYMIAAQVREVSVVAVGGSERSRLMVTEQ